MQLQLKGKKMTAHNIIAYLKFGEKAINLQVNHINGKKTDNRPCNLEMVTCSENNKHAFRTGLKKPTILRGLAHAKNKLNKEKILEIKRLSRNGMMQKDIANVIGVHKSTIGRVLRGETGLYID